VDAGTANQLGPTLKHEGPVNGAVFNKDESRILTWSGDNTARLWEMNIDLDFPRQDIKLWTQAVTGTELNIDSRQPTNIELDRWHRIQAEYKRLAEAHAKVCKYPRANQWILFHPEEQWSPRAAASRMRHMQIRVE
jgi:hypothetical protein